MVLYNVWNASFSTSKSEFKLLKSMYPIAHSFMLAKIMKRFIRLVARLSGELHPRQCVRTDYSGVRRRTSVSFASNL